MLAVGLLVWYQSGRTPPAPALPAGAGMTLGPAAAPVTVEEFADFQCPACRDAAQTVARRLEADAVAPDSQFRFIFRTFPFIGAESQRMAEAAVCAAGQDKFWTYHDKLFSLWRGENVGYFTRDRLVQVAADLGLDRTEFGACLEQGQAQAAVKADKDRGGQLGVRATPTFVVNGKLFPGVQPYEVLKQAITAAATAAGRK